MENSTLRRGAERTASLLPSSLRAALKRVYHARGGRRRVRTDVRGWWPRAARVHTVDPHPALVALTSEPTGRRRPDVCFVPPGPLDPVLDTLLRCEQDGVPVATLVADAAGLDSEVARCAAVVVLTDPQLRGAACAIAPDERVVVWEPTTAGGRHERLGPLLATLGFRVVAPRQD